MLPWSSLANVQMANNLIKWWRTKFLSGYKQFSVIHMDSNDGRLSDTEELLGSGRDGGNSVPGETTLPTCSTPPAAAVADVPRSSPLPPPQTNTATENKHLNLEEFSCDVSMEGGVYRDGQEFSFTLYDFDGHGKITKDDIAGLVTTIYETLGSSVKVPHYGSKTIKVKLTVSPDQRKRMSATVIDHKSPSTHGSTSTSPSQNQSQSQNTAKEHKNTYVKRHRQQTQCRRQKRGRDGEREHICCNVDVSDAELEYSDHCSRVSEDEITEDEGECSEDQIPKYPSRNKIKPKRYQKNSNFRHQMHFLPNAHIHPYSAPVLCTKARRNKKKSSSLQRKELLEIIQANMEKNNHSFQTTSRKQHINHVNKEREQTPLIEHKQHRHKHKTPHDSAAQLECLANIVNSENCYLDLATLQDDTQVTNDGQNLYKHVPYCRYDKLLGAVVCMSNCNLLQKSQLAPSSCRHKRHRSRSHDLSQMPFRYNLLESQKNNNANDLKNEVRENSNPNSTKKTNTKLKPCEINFEQIPTAFKKQVKKIPQVVLGHSSSPHHLKHRNRQEDQARAMAQVVRWLEQEFSSNVNVNMNKKSDSTKKNKYNSKFSPQQSPSARTSPSMSGAAVEHHHVHEHIHHHYHHYQEAPVVV